MSDIIREALSKLDPKNDDHWTEDGLPRIDALGFKKAPGRDVVTAAAPLFTRANPSLEAAPPLEVTNEVKGQPEVTPLTEDAVTVEDEGDPAEKLALLKVELDDHQSEIDKLNEQIGKAQARLTVVQEKHRTVVMQMERNRHHERENIAGIQAVLEANKVEREAQAGLATELRKSGITARLLQPGSPLDAAMARRNQRGTQRPNFTARA